MYFCNVSTFIFSYSKLSLSLCYWFGLNDFHGDSHGMWDDKRVLVINQEPHMQFLWLVNLRCPLNVERINDWMLPIHVIMLLIPGDAPATLRGYELTGTISVFNKSRINSNGTTTFHLIEGYVYHDSKNKNGNYKSTKIFTTLVGAFFLVRTPHFTLSKL